MQANSRKLENQKVSIAHINNDYIDLPNKQGSMTNDSVKLTEPAPYCLLKFIIQDGWEDFSSVHSIELL